MGLGDFFSRAGDQLANRLGVGSPAGSSDYKTSMADWKKQAGDWSDRWGHVADFDTQVPDDTNIFGMGKGTGTKTVRSATGKRFDELSGIYGGEVDRAAAQAGTQAAGAYSRRGMGDSGYAAGAQQQNLMKAAQQRVLAREAARSAAVGEQENILGNQAQISLAPYSAMFGAAAQRFMGNEQQQNAFNYNQMQKQEEWFQKMGSSMIGSGMAGGMGGGGGGG